MLQCQCVNSMEPLRPRGAVSQGSSGSALAGSSSADAAADSCGSGSAAAGFEVRLVLEWCDAGSLRAALDRRHFHQNTAASQPPAGDSGGVPPGGNGRDIGDGLDLQAVLQIALDVAQGMAHLHSTSVVHSGRRGGGRPRYTLICENLYKCAPP